MRNAGGLLQMECRDCSIEQMDKTRPGRSAIVVVAAALIVAGGVGGYLIAPTPGSSPSVASLPGDFSLCTNTAEGFAVGYPAAWYTTHLTAEDACQNFDPKSFEIPSESDFCCTQLSVFTNPGTHESAMKQLTDPMFYRTLSREDLKVGGLPAVRLELEATGELVEERGTLLYVYVVDRGSRGFLQVTTYRFPDRSDGYERRKTIVDRAAASLRFF